jgi:thioredoxin-related protein
MLRTCAFIGASLLFVLCLVAGRVSSGMDPRLEPWQADLNAAWQKAKATKRPLLLVASMEGCHYCEEMKRNTLHDRQVLAEIQHSYVPAAVKAADRPNLIEKLQIRIFPTTVIISPEGRVLDTIRGYVPPEQFRARLASVSSATLR